MSTTATRLITLIMMLQRRPNQKAADLAETLGVSVRSVHRYMGMLEEMGLPVYTERGPHGGFSLVRGYTMPPLMFTPEEAVAVYLGTGLVEEMWGTLYREAAQGALAKLDNVLPMEQQQEVTWAKHKLIATGMHRIDQTNLQPILATLRQAIREQQRTHLIYRGREHTTPTERDVDFYGLAYRWGWWYTVGYCHLRADHRVFRVDRMVGLTLNDETFNIPPDFDLRSYLNRGDLAYPQIEVTLKFMAEAETVVLNSQVLWASVTTEMDGSFLVTAIVPDVNFAVSLVLGFNGLAEVIAPNEVRQQVAKQALQISEQHKSSSD